MIKVIGRELQIPQNERKLGFESDNLVETRTFYITDKALFGLSFKLDVAEYGCTVDLDKSVMPDGSGMILTWTVTSGIMQNSGRINVQLRAFDTESSLVWHSEMQTFFVGESVNALKEIENVPLSEFEQVEIKATAAKEEAAIQANLAKEYAQESLSSANSANTKLDEHRSDNSNPHGVTASQVGAYTVEETDEKLSAKANTEHVHACAIPTPKSGDSNGGMNAGALFETGKDGFMSADDKQKLDGIQEGANKTVVDAILSNESENPISNKAVADEFEYIGEMLSKKANISHEHEAVSYSYKDISLLDLPYEELDVSQFTVYPDKLYIVDANIGFAYSGYADIIFTVLEVGGDYTLKITVDGTEICNESAVAGSTYSFKGEISDNITIDGVMVELGFTKFKSGEVDGENGVMTPEQAAKLDRATESLGDIGAALDELHAYAQGLISGGDA